MTAARSPGDAPPTAIGEVATLVLTLADADIRDGARLVHDANPLHHDLAAARAAGYPGLIASGAHTGAIFLGMTATHFSGPMPGGARRSMLGLGYELRFRAVVFADEPVIFRWTVASCTWKASLEGWVVGAEGEASTPRGLALSATSRFLLRRHVADASAGSRAPGSIDAARTG